MPKVSKARRNRGASQIPSSNKATISPLINEFKTSTKSEKQQTVKPITSSNDKSTTPSGQKHTVSGLSRGQRKRNAKKEQYLKRENMILSTLSLKRKEDQKKQIDGLDALKDALKDVISSDSKVSTVKKEEQKKATEVMITNKAKKSLAEKEIHHMNLVLQHPSFRQNPFATIQEHLKNTLFDQAEKQKILHLKQKKEEKKMEETRKKERKEKKDLAKYAKSIHKKRRNNKITPPVAKGRRRR